MQNHHRQLAAIMFTDIVGYTALMGDDEHKAFELLKENRRIHKPLIAHYRGKFIKELGDGVLASFKTATDAVLCAGAIQYACNQIPDLRLRIGIHLGDVMFENNDVFGDGVNIASRLQAQAPIGSIWISESVFKNISNKKEITATFVKEELLKHVKETVRIYEVTIQKTGTNILEEDHKFSNRFLKNKKLVWAALAALIVALALFYYYSADQKTALTSLENNPIDKSIAVLYFDNMSGDESQDYFSDGITEEIIAKLSHIKDLRVISRTSVLPFKGKGMNIKDIARTLNCSNILEGSVRKDGNKIRITAQLIDAIKDKHLWSQVFDRDLIDIFEIQSNVAESIANKFQLTISPEAQVQINHHPTANIQAYDLYLQSKAIMFRDRGLGVGNPGTNRQRAINYLSKALSFDPHFSEALALLSQVYFEYYYTQPSNKSLIDSAFALAQRAIEYNPKISDGYLAYARLIEYQNPLKALAHYQALYKIDPYVGLWELGRYYRERANFPEAMKYFSQAIQFQPNKPDGYLGKASIYSLMGQNDSALRYFSSATNIDPNEIEILNWKMAHYTFKGHVELGKKFAKQYFQDDSAGYYKNMGIAYLFKQDWKNAEAYYKKTTYRDMDYALVLWKTNRKDSAKIYFQNAINFRLKLPYNYGMDLSRIYAVLGDQENAIKNLKLGFKLGFHWYDWVKLDPYWNEIRNTPEFIKEEKEFDKRNNYMLAEIKKNEKNGVLPDLNFK